MAKEPLPAAVDRGLQSHRPGHVGRGVAQAFGDVGADVGPHILRPGKHLVLVRRQEGQGAQHFEGLVGAGAVGCRVFGVGENRAEQSGLFGEDRGDVGLGGGEAEIRGDRDPQPRQVNRGRGEEIRRAPDRAPVHRGRQRVQRVVAGDRTQQQAGIRDRPSHGTENGQVAPPQAALVAGHQAGRGPEPDDAAERRRVAQRPAGVRSSADRHHPGGQSDGGSSRGAGAGLRRVEGVAGRAIDRVAGVGAGAELRGVGLADDDRSRRTRRGDDPFVVIGDEVTEDDAAMGGDEAAGFLQVLDADRQAVQRRQLVAVDDRLVRLTGRRSGSGEVTGGDGVDRGVHRLDAGDAAFQQFAWGEAFGADQAAGLDGGQVAGFSHAHDRPAEACPSPAPRRRAG